MELTPQVLREVEFREKLRGYHPDDVDDFLEEAAVAVEGLLSRLHAAEQAGGASGGVRPAPPEVEPAPSATPAPVAPAPASEESASRFGGVPAEQSGGVRSGVSEETLRRTLLLAQQTADAVVADARAEADRILSEARAEAAALRSEAQEHATHGIRELEEQRAGLEHEVVALRSWAMQQRDRLREGLTDQVRSLDIWLATSAPPAGSSAPLAGHDEAGVVDAGDPAWLDDSHDEGHHDEGHHDEGHHDEGHDGPAGADVEGDSGDDRSGGGLFRRH